MVIRFKAYLLALSVSISLSVAFAESIEYSEDDFSIECSIDNSVPYERESCKLMLSLISPTREIAGVTEYMPPALDKGEFSFVSKAQSTRRIEQFDKNGKIFYKIPIGDFIFSISEKGKYTLKDGVYEIRIAYPVIVNDPFWGKVRTTRSQSYRIPINRFSFKVKALPMIDKNTCFSGAVGNFEVKTIVPPGDIIVNEEATAVIIVSGDGIIPEQNLPEYRDAFADKVKLKSVTENRNAYIDKGKMVSTLELECSFIPLECGNLEIGEVEFEFFNPETGKYIRRKSQPVKFKSNSSIIRKESIEI